MDQILQIKLFILPSIPFKITFLGYNILGPLLFQHLLLSSGERFSFKICYAMTSYYITSLLIEEIWEYIKPSHTQYSALTVAEEEKDW